MCQLYGLYVPKRIVSLFFCLDQRWLLNINTNLLFLQETYTLKIPIYIIGAYSSGEFGDWINTDDVSLLDAKTNSINSSVTYMLVVRK